MIRIGLVLAIAAACGKDEPPAAAPPAVSSTATAWSDVRPAAGHPLLEAPAVALGDPEQRAEVAVPSRARVLRVLVAAGDQVEAGAAVAEVAYPELAAAAASYLAASDQLAAQDRRHQQLEALRAEGLARLGDLSAVEIEQARLRGERDLAATSLRSAGIEPSGAQAFVAAGGRTRLRAPIAGVVVKVEGAIGQLRLPEAGPLIELAAAGVHRIEARLSQPLQAGASLVFVPAGGKERPATVVRSEPRQGSDGTTRVWLEVDGQELSAGQPGRLRVIVGDDVVAVPVHAISSDQHVWKRVGDKRERVPVTVVVTSGADALVRGLKVGDQVAASATEGAL